MAFRYNLVCLFNHPNSWCGSEPRRWQVRFRTFCLASCVRLYHFHAERFSLKHYVFFFLKYDSFKWSARVWVCVCIYFLFRKCELKKKKWKVIIVVLGPNDGALLSPIWMDVRHAYYVHVTDTLGFIRWLLFYFFKNKRAFCWSENISKNRIRGGWC